MCSKTIRRSIASLGDESGECMQGSGSGGWGKWDAWFPGYHL